jgi:hypothetical protein
MDPRIKKVIDSYKSSDCERIVGIGVVLEQLQGLTDWSWNEFRAQVKKMLDESSERKKPN